MDKERVSKIIQEGILKRGLYVLPDGSCANPSLPPYAQRVLSIIYKFAGNQLWEWSSDMSMTVRSGWCEIKFSVNSFADAAGQKIDLDAVKEALMLIGGEPFRVKYDDVQTAGLMLAGITVTGESQVELVVHELVWVAIVEIAHNIKEFGNYFPSNINN